MDTRELRGDYEDFIGSYSGVVDSQFCKEIIDEFDYFYDIGSVWNSSSRIKGTNSQRHDFAIDLHHIGNVHMGTHYSRELNDIVWGAWEEYKKVYGSLDVGGPFSAVHQKVQKTPTGGGFHRWHFEDSSVCQSNRTAVWMLYLNDNFKGGETEFLYYNKRVDAEQGKLLLWPAGYTHTHRGNLVLEGDKYIVTGWINLATGEQTPYE